MPQILKANDFFDSSLLPVQLYHTTSSIRLGFHSHEFTEIAILLRGRARYETDFSSELVGGGDVLVIPAGGLHSYREERDVELMNVLFQFDRLPIPSLSISRHPGYAALFRIQPDYYRKMKFYPRLHLPEAVIERVRELLLPAYRAQQQKELGAPLTVFGAFLQTIPILLAHYAPGSGSQAQPKLPEKLSACLDYMLRHYRDPLTVEELAHRAGLTPATFTRHFKEATGKTPLNFLLTHRLEEAAQLLRSGQYSVAEAAYATGFSDSNYFSRLFRKHQGTPPGRNKS